MRTLVILGLVVGGLVVAGAIHISQTNGTIEVSIDKQKVQTIAREGEEIIKRAATQAATQTK
jgi:hypothetical protein